MGYRSVSVQSDYKISKRLYSDLLKGGLFFNQDSIYQYQNEE
jgi:hypothetical protein